MHCEAPFTGPDCHVTYAEAAGTAAFWAYRAVYFVLGAALAILSIIEYKASSSAMRLPSTVSDDAAAIPAVVFQQQNYQKSIYLRLITASIVFIVCAIDPLGYSNIIGVDIWLILSGISSFFVLSVCISLIFVVVRRIALVSSRHGVLPYFNSLYVYSQIGMVLTWIVLPIVQVLVEPRYIVEAAKLTFSSVIFLMWTIGSLAYGISAVKNLKQTVDKRSSNTTFSSDVYTQRLSLLRMLNLLLWIASVLSIIFVGVQALDAVHAIRTRDDVNFDAKDHVPHSFADLFISGIFETIKQVFCFVVLGAMRYVRVTRQQTRDHIMAEKEADIHTGGEHIPLAEIPQTKQLQKLKQHEDHEDDESASSQTLILAESNHAAA